MSHRLSRFCSLAGATLALSGLLCAEAVYAGPVVLFEDNTSPVPGVYEPGVGFILDLALSFEAGDLSMTPADDVAGGVSFDLAFQPGGAMPDPAITLTLVSRDNTGSVLGLFNNFDDDFGPVDFSAGTGSDLGQLSFSSSFPAGDIFLASYSFLIADDLAAGEYEISLNGTGISPIVTAGSDPFNPFDVPVDASRFVFQVVVPEPASAFGLAGGLLCFATGRRGGSELCFNLCPERLKQIV